jgi:hypothetical protein
VFAYDVQDAGTVKNKRPFVHLHDIPAGMESGADGMVRPTTICRARRLSRDERPVAATVWPS